MVDINNSIYAQQQLAKLSQNGNSTPKNAQVETAEGQDFKSLLQKSLSEVNRLQTEAQQATNDLVTGKTDNVAEVFTAVKKADLAFQTLMQMRNKLQEAYDEIKQIKV